MSPDPTRRMLSCLVGLVHCKGDGCKRKAALESISAQLRSRRQDRNTASFSRIAVNSCPPRNF